VLYVEWRENSQSYFHTLQALDVSPTFDAAVKSIIQLFPHSSQHYIGNSSHSLSDAPLQIINISWQWGYTHSILHVASEKEVTRCQIRWPGGPSEQRQVYVQHVQSVIVGGWQSGNGAHPCGSDQAYHLVGKWSHANLREAEASASLSTYSDRTSQWLCFLWRTVHKLFCWKWQNTSLGESRSCSQATWGFSEPHTRTLWWLTFPLMCKDASSLKINLSAHLARDSDQNIERFLFHPYTGHGFSVSSFCKINSWKCILHFE
jgi:hypothetical protein